MKRPLVWLAGVIGLAALGRALTRRRGVEEPAPAPAAEPIEADPRAAELRAKLDEAKAAEDDRAEPGQVPADDTDPDARRRAVHDAGRAALDEMKGDATEE